MEKTQKMKILAIWIFTIVWAGIIVYLSFQNGEQTARTSIGIAERLAEFFYGNPTQEQLNMVHMMIRKLAHIGLFFGLGVLVYVANRVTFSIQRLLMPMGIVAAYGFFDEWHKQFISGRHFDPGETVLNICCGLAGIVVCWLIDKKHRN